MLKSLGSTFAQIAERLGRGSPALLASMHATERAQHAIRRAQRRRRNRALLWLVVSFFVIVLVFSFVFHEVMASEGRTYSWPTSIYWTLTTMTTLGFGDITFQSDAGRIFSVVVLLSGSTLLLVMVPFVFIQFVFMPWMAERDRRRAPRSLPESVEGHLLITGWGPVEAAIADRADQAGVSYALIVEDVAAAAGLADEGRTVMVGGLDDPATYRDARVERAALVMATNTDPTNTNTAFTVREQASDVPIVATANSPASVDILEIAGATHVVQLGEILGQAMATRGLGLGGKARVIGEFADLLIAESGIVGTTLIGATLEEAQLRARFGIGIIGVWERGVFDIATADTALEESSILLLTGTAEQLDAFTDSYAVGSVATRHAVIIGGGRVGRAVGRAYATEGISFTIVEKDPLRNRSDAEYVIGDAAERTVLEAARIDEAETILITTHDDDINVYLTRYCRGLRPEARIVSRARLDRNVSTLYRAGADAVLSYAATGSTAIWNYYRGDETVLVAQGLSVFRVPVPRELAGATLAETHVYRRTGCNVVAVQANGAIKGNPDPRAPLPAGGELVIVGTDADAAKFFEAFPNTRWGRRRR